jgi:hypothetical protein
MCKKLDAASQDQLSTLRDPAALAAIEVLKQTGWFAADAQSLEQFFKADPSHPAKVALDEEARNGGQHAVLQVAVLLGFTAIAIFMSSVQRTLSPTVFVLWGALGVCAGLLAAKYPGRIFGKR